MWLEGEGGKGKREKGEGRVFERGGRKKEKKKRPLVPFFPLLDTSTFFSSDLYLSLFLQKPCCCLLNARDGEKEKGKELVALL